LPVLQLLPLLPPQAWPLWLSRSARSKESIKMTPQQCGVIFYKQTQS
jgi:hypothetical protein